MNKFTKLFTICAVMFAFFTVQTVMAKDFESIIKKSPLTMECTVTDKYTTNGFESFICAIDATYVDEKHLDAQGKINYATLKPVMFEFPTYSYLSTGGVLGKCLSFKNNDSRGHVQ